MALCNSSLKQTVVDPLAVSDLLDAADNIEYTSICSSEAHIWFLSTVFSKLIGERLWRLLSIVEQQRADRFVFAADRDRFVGAHAALRLILQLYENIPAPWIRFATSGSRGKPILAHGTRNVQFNLSHSGQYALVVVAASQECGVDIEEITPNVSIANVRPQVFLSDELDWIDASDSSKRAERAVRAWTIKEAIVKAVGHGVPLIHRVNASPVLHSAYRKIHLKDLEYGVDATIFVREFKVLPGYSSAVAMCGEDLTVSVVSRSSDLSAVRDASASSSVHRRYPPT